MNFLERADIFEEKYTDFYYSLIEKGNIGGYEEYLKNGINTEKLKILIYSIKNDLYNKIIGKLNPELQKIDIRLLAHEKMQYKLFNNELYIKNKSIYNIFKRVLKYYTKKIDLKIEDIISVYNASILFSFSAAVFTTNFFLLNGRVLRDKINERIISYNKICNVYFKVEKNGRNQHVLVIEMTDGNKYKYISPHYTLIFSHMTLNSIVKSLKKD